MHAVEGRSRQYRHIAHTAAPHTQNKSTHTEIKIGTHIDIYTNFVAKQYIGVKAERRYLKRI